MCYVQRRFSGKRARHIPNRNDTVVRFGPEHVVLFLHLCNLVSKNATRLLHLTAFLRGKGTCDGIVCKLALCLV